LRKREIPSAGLRKCAVWAFSALLSLTLGACSLVLDTSTQQCTVDGDCVKRSGPFANSKCIKSVCVAQSPGTGGSTSSGGSGSGGGGGGGGGSPMQEGGVDAAPDAQEDPVWGCLGHVVWPMPTTTTVKLAIPFFDLIQMKPIFDITLKMCNRLDTSCSNPVRPPVMPDADGLLRVEAIARFDGYGFIEASPMAGADAGGSDRWIPSLLYFNPPLVRDITYGQIPLFSGDDLSILAASQGNTIDPTLGTVFIGALDCSGKPAAGVTWVPSSVVAGTKRFFYIDGLPKESANATNETGFGGLINAPTGTLTVTGSILATGKPIGSATVLVRSGYSSYTYLAPSPSP
jgi:hypothetical protein